MGFLKSKNEKLLVAAGAGNETKVLKLLDSGADINSMNEFGNTPLHQASYRGHLAVVKTLLARGADVDAKSGHDRTPLHKASLMGHVAVVKALLANGADVDAKNKDGETSLHPASAWGHTDVVEALLAGGATVNTAVNRKKSLLGLTPLHRASSQGHVAVAEALLSRGASVLATDAGGDTPRDLAESCGQADVVRVLDAAQASPNSRESDLSGVSAEEARRAADVKRKVVMALDRVARGEGGANGEDRRS